MKETGDVIWCWPIQCFKNKQINLKINSRKLLLTTDCPADFLLPCSTFTYLSLNHQKCVNLKMYSDMIYNNDIILSLPAFGLFWELNLTSLVLTLDFRRTQSCVIMAKGFNTVSCKCLDTGFWFSYLWTLNVVTYQFCSVESACQYHLLALKKYWMILK